MLLIGFGHWTRFTTATAGIYCSRTNSYQPILNNLSAEYARISICSPSGMCCKRGQDHHREQNGGSLSSRKRVTANKLGLVASGVMTAAGVPAREVNGARKRIHPETSVRRDTVGPLAVVAMVAMVMSLVLRRAHNNPVLLR